MEFLWLVLLGLTIDRYILPIFDLVLEYVSHMVNKVVVSISIDTQRQQLKFKQECMLVDEPQRIGFEYPEQTCEEIEYYENEEDEEKCKIGFNCKK